MRYLLLAAGMVTALLIASSMAARPISDPAPLSALVETQRTFASHLEAIDADLKRIKTDVESILEFLQGGR